MLPLEHPDRIQICFDDHRLVANVGLILPVTLSQHLGLRELVDNHVDLRDALGRANPDNINHSTWRRSNYGSIYQLVRTP